MRQIVSCENRLKKMLIADKKENPAKIERVLKSELFYLLRNFFELNSDDLNVDIIVNSFGKFEFIINGIATNIKRIHTFD